MVSPTPQQAIIASHTTSAPLLAVALLAHHVLNPVHDVLTGRFATIYERLNHLRHLPYGTAYDHCLCERHGMGICATLNIQTGGWKHYTQWHSDIL